MRRIVQRQQNDCGVACVAMLAGVSYAVAKNILFPDSDASYTMTRDLRVALIALGMKPAPRLIPLRSRLLQAIPGAALLKTAPNGRGWHWCVWDGKRVLDPRPVPYTRILHVSYIVVR